MNLFYVLLVHQHSLSKGQVFKLSFVSFLFHFSRNTAVSELNKDIFPYGFTTLFLIIILAYNYNNRVFVRGSFIVNLWR